VRPKIPAEIHRLSGMTLRSRTSANSHKHLAKLANSTTPSDATAVQLVSTIRLPPPDMPTSESVNKSGPADVINLGFAPHCITATLIRPDQTHKLVSILWDTGALQSLVCSHYLTADDYVSTDDSSLICGVTAEVIFTSCPA